MKNKFIFLIITILISFSLTTIQPQFVFANCCNTFDAGFSGTVCPESGNQILCPKDPQTYCDELNECPSSPHQPPSSPNQIPSSQTNNPASQSQNSKIDINSYNQAIGLDHGKIKDFSLAGITNVLLPYLLTISGLILLAMLIAGGLTMLTGATNKESQEKGKKMITNSLIGFFIVFLAYFIAQALQVIFKIDIVGK